MKKAVWMRFVAMILALVLVGCGASSPEQAESNSTTASEEELLSDEQKNAIAMLNYLAFTAERISDTKNNRLLLEDVYSSLINEINPGAIDETTQQHLNEMRNVLKDLLNVEAKRERLKYVYDHEKAMAIRNAVPHPVLVKAITDARSWTQLALAVVTTAVDSYNNYREASDRADYEYFLSGWDIDQEERNIILRNRDYTFNYMTDIVQDYGTEDNKEELGKLTLNENAIAEFAEICAIDEPQRKLERLRYTEETYKYFGNYWLELADCYYETEEYKKCLECVAKYQELDITIFRKDFNIVPILPKAIVAAQYVYGGEECFVVVKTFADAIIENTNTDEWAARYFAAQTYMDLYAKTDEQSYLQTAYDIALHNVSELVEDQKEINETYLQGVQKISIDDKQDKRWSEDQKEQEQERIDAYNDALKKVRKSELPSVYEPLRLNCELLFALAEELGIDANEKAKISSILQSDEGGVFLCIPINNKYSFNEIDAECVIKFTDEKIAIPANMLVQGATICATVVNGGETTVIDDFKISEVVRGGETVDSFVAHWTSEQMDDYKWSADAKITVTISNGDYCDPIALNFKVSNFEENWIFSDTVVFEQT